MQAEDDVGKQQQNRRANRRVIQLCLTLKLQIRGGGGTVVIAGPKNPERGAVRSCSSGHLAPLCDYERVFTTKEQGGGWLAVSQLEHLAVALRVVAVRAGVARLRVRVASVRIAVLLALGLLGVRTIPFEETAPP